MPDFSIKIIPASSYGGPDQFQPDLNDSQPGDPLYAPQYSCISWNNTTDQDHEITLSDPKSFDSGPVPAHGSSKVQYAIQPASGTITYKCSKHENETGQIIVTEVQDLGTEEA